jgi:predicted RNA binding protein YcfA (HicA-like mRNA interferase family)
MAGTSIERAAATGKYRLNQKKGVVTIAGKPNDDLAPGTQNSILKQAGLK